MELVSVLKEHVGIKIRRECFILIILIWVFFFQMLKADTLKVEAS